MKQNITNPLYHFIYWLLVIAILTLIFGRSWKNSEAAFFYIVFLLPVVIGTSYFFNFFLVPKYLLKKKYTRFALYSFYTLVISLYLEMIVLTFSFIYLVNFNMRNMGPNSSDTLLLAVVLYLVVFLGSFLFLTQQISLHQQEISKLTEESEKMKTPFLEVMSNRQLKRVPYKDILYIESLSDYIKIVTIGNGEIISREKISNIEKKLPDIFLRIHRSFIVHIEKITRFNYDEVEVDNITLNIGRSYKKLVRERLKSDY